MTDEPKVYRAPLSDFKQLPDNPNVGTERGLYMLEQSVEGYGAGRSMLAGSDNVFIAGNHFAEVAGEKLGDEVIVVETDGDTPVVVKRRDVAGDSPKGREMAVADNRSSEVGLHWDEDVMRLMDEAADINLEKWFREDELAEWLPDPDPAPDPGAQIDKAAELQEKWRVERGQVWEIPSASTPGKAHRLMCGDSTSAEDVARLMGHETPNMFFCDMPYDAGDNIVNLLVSCAPSDYCSIFLMGADTQLVKIAARYPKMFRRFFAVNMKTDVIMNAKAPVTIIDLVAEFRKGKTNFQNLHDAFSTYIESGNDHQARREYKVHAKLPAMVAKFLLHYTKKGQLVVDGFVGGGSTFIAAEQTGRFCYGVELNEAHCSVTLERLSEMGLIPTLVVEPELAEALA
jgi:hypothetical protein